MASRSGQPALESQSPAQRRALPERGETSPGPILFRQRRVGRDGCVFELLEFRTMRVADDHVEGFMPNSGAAPGGVEGSDRRTPIGRWLRCTSLDELPQLVNVLRWEMSLNGPRPERPEFVELFHQDTERYGERHRVRSGITGWAQLHGLRGQTSIAAIRATVRLSLQNASFPAKWPAPF